MKLKPRGRLTFRSINERPLKPFDAIGRISGRTPLNEVSQILIGRRKTTNLRVEFVEVRVSEYVGLSSRNRFPPAEQFDGFSPGAGSRSLDATSSVSLEGTFS